jgi:hypothetical protein
MCYFVECQTEFRQNRELTPLLAEGPAREYLIDFARNEVQKWVRRDVGGL